MQTYGTPGSITKLLEDEKKLNEVLCDTIFVLAFALACVPIKPPNSVTLQLLHFYNAPFVAVVMCCAGI